MSKTKNTERAERIRKELWKTFVYEFEELLDNIEQQLLQLDGDYKNESLVSGLFRTMHTVKGTCGMMGLNNVEKFTHNAEDLLDFIRDGKAELNSTILDVLFNVSDVLKNAGKVIIEEKSDATFVAPDELVTQLKNMLSDIDKAYNQAQVHLDENINKSEANHQAPSYNLELLKQLIAETMEAIDDLEKICLDLESAANNKTLIDDLFRTVHSLKGNLNLAGMTVATQLLHTAEDMIGRVREGFDVLGQVHVDLLLRLADLLRQHFQLMTRDVVDLTQDATLNLLTDIQQIDHNSVKQSSGVTVSGDNKPREPSSGLGLVEGDGLISLDVEYVNAFIDLFHEQSQIVLDNLDSVNINYESLQFQLDDLKHACSIVGATAVSLLIDDIVNLCSQRPIDATHVSTLLKSCVQSLGSCRDNLEEFNIHAIQVAEKQDNCLLPDKSTVLTSSAALESTFLNNECIPKMTQESYFEQLWSILSATRKALNGLRDNLVGKLLSHIDMLEKHASLVDELDITDLIQEFRGAIEIENNLDSCARLLQRIYTVCWDLEELVLEADGTLTFVSSDHQQSSKISAPEEHESEEHESSTENDVFQSGLKEAEKREVITHGSSAPVIPQSPLKSDVTVDPLFVLDFISESRDQLTMFEQTVTHYAKATDSEKPQLFQELIRLLNDVTEGASGVEVFSVQELCQSQLDQLNSPHWQFDADVLSAFIVELYRVFVQVQDSIPESVQRRHHSDLNLSHVFKRWHADQCLQLTPWIVRTLTHLYKEQLESETQGLLSQTVKPDFLVNLSEVGNRIESFLFAAQFYKLQITEKAILVFRDYIVRAGFNSFILTSEAIDLLIQVVKEAANTINQTAIEGEASEYNLKCLSERLAGAVESNSDEALLLSAKRFLLSGDIPKCLEEVLDDATLVQVAQALDEERNVFLLYVDVDHDDNLSDKTFEFMNSDQLKPLMSATEFLEDRSIFQCLIETKNSETTLAQILLQIDPTEHYLYLKSFSLNTQSFADNAHAIQHIKPPELQQHHLAHLNETISDLVAAKSTVDQISLGGEDEDLFDLVDNVVAAHGSWAPARFAVQKILVQIGQERKSLQQAQEQFAVHLQKVQHGLRQLQEIPVRDICQSIVEALEDGPLQGVTLRIVCDNDELLVENKHIVSLQKVILDSIQCVRVATQGAPLVDIACTLKVFDRLDETVFQLMWSSDVTVLLNKSSNVWSTLGQEVQRISEEFCQDVDFKLHLDAKNKSMIELGIARHLDVIDAIIVRLENDFYVIPTQLVQRIVNATEAEYISGSAMEESRMVKVGSELYPLVDLVKKQNSGTLDRNSQQIVLLLQYESSTCSVIVDELLGMQQVVLSPLHSELQSNSKLLSCVVLGRDRIGLVLKSSAVFTDCA